ncbi:nicotinate (nicotinamide) nucleotide adenylyltransferase [uncultured Parabacteroides sp.]|uniref:nicotinate (nicotinamide) nucleotide adenylyltransferase n=1 Tax=uncultured Parabacteroides sp. TaxID=512312 RepID=UPI0025E0C001|nr:nicotinate (nicotinamide) nucleotide adenylyltransferase [uncultured Parabacteroides sp.]
METGLKENTAGKRKTGIYSGSFNPVHIGHLALANWLCEFTELDEIWFLITPHNPLKEKEELIDDRLRYELVKKSIAGYPKFKVSDIEFSLPQPTYTIDTLRTLDRLYPEREFYFIMGADNWTSISRWKESETIIANYPILIYPRKGYEVKLNNSMPHIRYVEAPQIEVSSTFIRQSLRTGKDVRFFLPEAIRDILQH